MTGLLDACLRVPTALFSVALGIVILYWLFVLVGALDVDLFGGHAVAGAAKGIGDALAGHHGLGDATVGAKGMAEALKPDMGHPDAGGGFWNALGLATVPITISFSVVVVVGWSLSILGMHYGGKLLGPDSILLAIAVFALTIVAGIPLAGLLVRPLKPIFRLRAGKSNRDYVGAICSITTGKVTRDFGQATVEDGGTVLVITVCCDHASTLKRGDRALIIDFDQARHAYLVEPVGDPTLLP
jgi:hypothetical protein